MNKLNNPLIDKFFLNYIDSIKLSIDIVPALTNCIEKINKQSKIEKLFFDADNDKNSNSSPSINLMIYFVNEIDISELLKKLKSQYNFHIVLSTNKNLIIKFKTINGNKQT